MAYIKSDAWINNYDSFRELLIGRRIIEWTKDSITLDNGVVITIECTDNDCCAQAYGNFSNVELDAAITYVSKPEYHSWEDDYTFGCGATVRFMHNQNVICSANANADAGNGGYYYSVASFILHLPEKKKTLKETINGIFYYIKGVFLVHSHTKDKDTYETSPRNALFDD